MNSTVAGSNTRLSAFTQKEMDAASNSSYFQRVLHKHEDQGKVYDAIFHPRHDYEPKVSRDDKAIDLTLKINQEEKVRTVPVLSSSVYGWRVDKPLEARYKKYARVQLVKGFLRARGTCIPLVTEMGELNVKGKPQ